MAIVYTNVPLANFPWDKKVPPLSLFWEQSYESTSLAQLDAAITQLISGPAGSVYKVSYKFIVEDDSETRRGWNMNLSVFDSIA